VKPLPLLAAALVLALLGGGIWYSEKHPPKPDTDVEAKPAVKMVSIQEDQISKIRITNLEKDVVTTIEKQPRGGWSITEPKALPADPNDMKLLVANLASLEAEQVVTDKNTDWTTYGLDKGKLKVEATLGGGKTLQVLFGNQAPTGDPVYARVSGDDRLFGVAPGTKGNFEKNSGDLRDKRLLHVDTDQVSKMLLTSAQNSGDKALEFGHAAAEWQILRPFPMRADNYAADDLLHAGASNFDSIVAEDDNDKEAKKHNFSKPWAVLSVFDPSGEHKLTVIEEKVKAKPATAGKGSEDTVLYYARTSDAPGVYKISQGSVATLGKPVAGFRNGRLFDLNFNDPEKIELRDGDLRLTIDKKTDQSKKEDQWFNGKKQLAGEKVQSLLSQIRRLAAATYPSEDAAQQSKFGLDKPVVDVKITMAGGKAQRAVIASAGGKFYAARDGDPATYEIQALEVTDLKKFISDLK
jgi:hypothetical protein